MLQLLILHWFQSTELLRKTQWTFWSALYFARRVNTCRILSGELEVLWNCIHFFYCSPSKLMQKLERKTDLLKFQETYFMQSTWMQMLLATLAECSSSLHYEMCQSIISNANKSMHIIFSIATRGAICMHSFYDHFNISDKYVKIEKQDIRW